MEKKLKKQGWPQGASLAASQAALVAGCRELVADYCELAAGPCGQLKQAGHKGGKARGKLPRACRKASRPALAARPRGQQGQALRPQAAGLAAAGCWPRGRWSRGAQPRGSLVVSDLRFLWIILGRSIQ